MWRLYVSCTTKRRISFQCLTNQPMTILNPILELPYEGAKEMLLVDDVENRVFLRELLEAMYDELPASKKRKK